MKIRDKYEIVHIVVTVAKPIIILFILGFVYLFIFQKFDVGILYQRYGMAISGVPGNTTH